MSLFDLGTLYGLYLGFGLVLGNISKPMDSFFQTLRMLNMLFLPCLVMSWGKSGYHAISNRTKSNGYLNIITITINQPRPAVSILYRIYTSIPL